MRTPEEVASIIGLSNTHNNCEISRKLSIPRTTIGNILLRHKNPDKYASSLSEDISLKRGLPLFSEIDPYSELAKNYSYILGLYLGDGHINKTKRSYKIVISLDCCYSGIIESTVIAASFLYPYNKVSFARKKGDNCTNVLWHSNRLPEDFPQHGPGMKHTRKIELADWQKKIVKEHPKQFLRGLIQSDGCRDLNHVNGKDYPRYQFNNKSLDIIGLCEQALVQLEVSFTSTKKKSTGVTVLSIAKRKDVAFLDTFIGPKADTLGILPSTFRSKNPIITHRFSVPTPSCA